MIRVLILLILILAFFTQKKVLGQDIKGAKISFFQDINIPLRYTATLELYVNETLNYNRPFTLLNWGTGLDTLYYNFSQTLGQNCVKKIYSGTHTYSSSGSYNQIYMDTFRIAGINNFNDSFNDSISLVSEIIIDNFLGTNSPAIVNEELVNIIENDGIYTFNPNVSNPDGDSLHFELIECYGKDYSFPPNTSIDPSNGIITTFPNQISNFSYCVKISEWDSQSKIYKGSSTFDFLIDVSTLVGKMEMIVLNNLLSVCPNPTSGKVAVVLTTNDPESEIAVYNTLGQQVYTTVLGGSAVVNHTIDLSNQPKGIYFLQAGELSTKIVVE